MFCLIFSIKPIFNQKLRTLGNFQLFTSLKDTKIRLEKWFSAVIIHPKVIKKSKAVSVLQYCLIGCVTPVTTVYCDFQKMIPFHLDKPIPLGSKASLSLFSLHVRRSLSFFLSSRKRRKILTKMVISNYILKRNRSIQFYGHFWLPELFWLTASNIKLCPSFVSMIKSRICI